ncbi:MAG: FAD-binding oxidoreductase [Chloroflexi bacterium]|nr:FAD-binding oxidoreductase [Chloroflexota bacterium]
MNPADGNLAQVRQAAPGVAWLEAPADLAAYAVDGLTPRLAARPHTPRQAAEALAAAAGAGWAVVPWGGGTHMAVGQPRRRLDLALDLRSLHGISEHDRDNLTVTVQAGCTLAALQGALRAARQWLPLEAPDPSRATVGGVLAANTSGPRRLRYGTARDLVLGLEVALPNGELIHPGGKTVKNVAGYDLSRLFIGAWGTLGVLTAATFRLVPLALRSSTVWASFAHPDEAFAFAQALCGSRLGLAAVEVISAPLAGLPPTAGAALWVATLWEGSEAAVRRALREAPTLAQGALALGELTGPAHDALWTALARNGLGQGGPGSPLLRVGAPPSRLAEAWRLLECASFRQVRGGSGLLYAVWPAAEAMPLAAWRAELAQWGGYLALERGPLPLRRAEWVWGPADAAARPMRALKQALDPRGCLNPGLLGEDL